MELRPLACLCLLTLSSTTSAEGSGPEVVKVAQDLDVTLPCSTSTEQNIVDGYFDWNKVATKDEGRKEVFLYDNKKHTNTGRGSQSEEFKDRVVHFPELLQYGNASIIIQNTKMEDNGEYTCNFPNLQPPEKYLIKLVVERVLKDRTDENIPGAAPKPNIETLIAMADWVVLQCEVNGNPEPEVEWRDSSGKVLPAEKPQVSYRNRRFFITVNTTVTRSGSYRCVATQVNISHEIYSKTSVHFSEPPIINAYEGIAVSLPCSLDTKANIESELFEWRKDGQKEVFMFDGGKHSRNGHGSQSEEFKGRVFHFQDRLKHGDASITITNAKMSDRGNYTCEFPNLQPRQTFHMELVVVIGDGRSGPQSDGSEFSTGAVVGIVFALLVGVGVGAFLARKYKCPIPPKRNKENQKKQPAEEVKSDLSPDPEASIPLKTQ